MSDETIWEALEPVALGVGWFTIACLIAWTVIGLTNDIARQVREARRNRYRAQVEETLRLVNRETK